MKNRGDARISLISTLGFITGAGSSYILNCDWSCLLLGAITGISATVLILILIQHWNDR